MKGSLKRFKACSWPLRASCPSAFSPSTCTSSAVFDLPLKSHFYLSLWNGLQVSFISETLTNCFYKTAQKVRAPCNLCSCEWVFWTSDVRIATRHRTRHSGLSLAATGVVVLDRPLCNHRHCRNGSSRRYYSSRHKHYVLWLRKHLAKREAS